MFDEVKIVKESYDKNPQEEWDRLEGFHFEFEITKHMMNKYMRPGKVLDIGGGPGRYSLYLASLGYDVTLVDLSEDNVEFALKKAQELNLNIKAYQCDARDLSKLNLEKYDNILLMGPLYHLFKEEDRIKCILEARNYLNKDGVLFASFISLTGGINYYLSECPDELVHEQSLELIDCMEEDKSWSGMAFMPATFVENEEIEPLFDRLGFYKISMFGQEGITATRLTHLENANEDVRKLYLDISLRLCEKKKYLAYSNHVMYVGSLI